MFKKLLVILFAAFLLTGCADNLYPPADEISAEEAVSEDVTEDETVEETEEVVEEELSDKPKLPEKPKEEPVGTTETTTEDIMDDEGNDIGDVTTEITDENITTAIHIDLNPNPEGVECNSSTDCGEDANGIQKICIHEKCEEVECFWSSDCDNKLCFDNECLTPDDIYSRYEQCYVDRNPCKDIVCENCKLGNLQCSMSGEGDLEVRYCSECISDYNCNEGYSCVEHTCQ